MEADPRQLNPPRRHPGVRRVFQPDPEVPHVGQVRLAASVHDRQSAPNGYPVQAPGDPGIADILDVVLVLDDIDHEHPRGQVEHVA